MKTLLHACCAPCSVQCVQTLRDEGTEPVLFWYNPNIHPFTEYRSRRNALTEYAAKSRLELAMRGEYGLRSFIAGVYPDFAGRCAYCYRTRLEETARYAAEHGYESFCTTLLISPYQNHEMICRIARQAAEQYDVEFLYRDFRPHFREGQQSARDMGLYMQKYCGCIFSEEERYQKRRNKKEF